MVKSGRLGLRSCPVGVAVGDLVLVMYVGLNVGVGVGEAKGLDEGVTVRCTVGLDVMVTVGPGVGDIVGNLGRLGLRCCLVGAAVGDSLLVTYVGFNVGVGVRSAVGLDKGVAV